MKTKIIFSLVIVVAVVLVIVVWRGDIKPSDESREVTFWGTANIDAQVLKTDFTNQPKLVLKVLKVNNYSLDGAPEKSLFEGDEITVLVGGETKSQIVCIPTDTHQDVIAREDKIVNSLPGNIVCINNDKTGLVECSSCKEDKSINPYENWNFLKLKQNDVIHIEVRREGSSYKYSGWGLVLDSTISF